MARISVMERRLRIGFAVATDCLRFLVKGGDADRWLCWGPLMGTSTPSLSAAEYCLYLGIAGAWCKGPYSHVTSLSLSLNEEGSATVSGSRDQKEKINAQ